MSKSTLRVVFCSFLLFCLILLSPSYTRIEASPDLPIWLGFMYEASHSGRTGEIGPDFPRVKWFFETGNPITSTPVIDSEGNIYFLTTSGTLYSFTPEGSLRWSFETHTGDPLASFWVTPYLSPWSNEIYFGASNQMFALFLDGTLKWNVTLPDAVNGSPNLTFFGLAQSVKAPRLYLISTADGTFNCLEGLGPPEGYTFPPAMANAGTTLLVPYQGGVAAFDEDLNRKWDCPLSGTVFSLSVDSDSISYPHTQNNLYGMRTDGSLKWQIPFKATSLPAVGFHNTLYLGSTDKCFYAINPETSETIWKFTEGNGLYSAATVDSKEVIYFGSGDGKLYALKSSGEKKWVFDAGSAVTAPPSIGKNKAVYFGTAEGIFYALEEGPAPFSPSASPPSPPLSFPDVPSSFWAHREIMELASMGIINGYPDGTFKPELAVTRAEFAKMALLSSMLAPESHSSPSFPDVPSTHWAYQYVEGAAKYGLVKGYPDGTFKPDANITMAEVLTVIVRAREWSLQDPPGPPPYIMLSGADASTRQIGSEDWFYQYVGASMINGLILFPDYPQITTPGSGGGEYIVSLNSPASRAQTAVFLFRALPRLSM
ncbi:MAG: S-layer homology domain-containing protein [Caldiserica bacterium]|nr:S-layer homology domain-containing protein [Caldisericota bacterium]MDH7562821.1 S-layer homology domain-containing protein [Caldisericota bacterium]